MELDGGEAMAMKVDSSLSSLLRTEDATELAALSTHAVEVSPESDGGGQWNHARSLVAFSATSTFFLKATGETSSPKPIPPNKLFSKRERELESPLSSGFSSALLPGRRRLR